MSRSIKKGPYVAPELLKRVNEMNKTGEKTVLKTWSRSSTIFPPSSATLSLSTTVAVMCLSMSRRTWWVTSWVSSLPPAPSVATPRKLKGGCRDNGS